MDLPFDIPPEATKLAADFVKRNSDEINSISHRLLKGVTNQIRLRLPQTYTEYLTNAGERFGKSKSFFIRSTPTNIYEFYVPLGVSCGREKIPHVTYSDIIELTDRAVVTGTAGSGKSMQ